MIEQRWIPVSERLPEISRCVLALYENGVYAIEAYVHPDGAWRCHATGGHISAPQRWMPLPKDPEQKQ